MYALTVWLDIIPLRDCVLPPFTSKVTRTAFAHLTGIVPKLGRRASFSLLFRDGKPIYKVYDERSSVKPLIAREGEKLRTRYSLLIEKVPEPPSASMVFQIEVVDVNELWLDLPRKFVIHFLTPTLLPVPGRGSLMKALGVRRRYRLLPDLPLALALLVHDFRLQGFEIVKRSFSEVYRWSLKALSELDYQVKPVTVLYGMKDGRPITERGFTGYVAYELLDLNSSMTDDLKRLLGYASRFGLGKSRGVGFGHVEISSLQ
ncbi:MAG: CRISPR system precrRNA processing endoribonuclease RAMP protein Cas6 [Thermofilaceae archaeon]